MEVNFPLALSNLSPRGPAIQNPESLHKQRNKVQRTRETAKKMGIEMRHNILRNDAC